LAVTLACPAKCRPEHGLDAREAVNLTQVLCQRAPVWFERSSISAIPATLTDAYSYEKAMFCVPAFAMALPTPERKVQFLVRLFFSFLFSPRSVVITLCLARSSGMSTCPFNLSSGRALKIVLWLLPVQPAGASLV
jgi:hypothetical protein